MVRILALSILLKAPSTFRGCIWSNIALWHDALCHFSSVRGDESFLLWIIGTKTIVILLIIFFKMEVHDDVEDGVCILFVSERHLNFASWIE